MIIVDIFGVICARNMNVAEWVFAVDGWCKELNSVWNLD